MATTQSALSPCPRVPVSPCPRARVFAISFYGRTRLSGRPQRMHLTTLPTLTVVLLSGCVLGASLPQLKHLTVAELAKMHELEFNEVYYRTTNVKELPDLPEYAPTEKKSHVPAVNVFRPLMVKKGELARNLFVLSAEHKTDCMFKDEALRLPHFIDTWYWVKRETGVMCPLRERTESREQHALREELMKRALNLLKRALLFSIGDLALEREKLQGNLDTVNEEISALSSRLADKSPCAGIFCQFRPCEICKGKAQLVNKQQNGKRLKAGIDKIAHHLAMKIKEIRKLAAIADEDWEAEIERDVELHFPDYDMDNCCIDAESDASRERIFERPACLDSQ